MPIDFWSSAERASATAPDQTIAIGGYGLTDLNNDDWNNHGPRFQLYSQLFLWYMGMHSSQRREVGDFNIIVNYVRTMSDYITNFCYGKPPQFRCAEQYSAIIPRLLHDVWELHNNKMATLWEIGQTSGLCGDAFCVTPDSEALTPLGWMNLAQLRANPGIAIATMNPETEAMEWQVPKLLNVFDYTGDLVHHKSTSMDHLSTPDHDMWVKVRSKHGQPQWGKRKSSNVRNSGYIYKAAAEEWDGTPWEPIAIPATEKQPALVLSDPKAFARFVGWFVTEGHASKTGMVCIDQFSHINPSYYEEIAECMEALFPNVTRWKNKVYMHNAVLARWLREEFGGNAKSKKLPRWVMDWPKWMLIEMLDAMIKGDGTKKTRDPQNYQVFTSTSDDLIDCVQEVALKIGRASSAKARRQHPYANINGKTYAGSSRKVHLMEYSERSTCIPRVVSYSGEVWCPTVDNGLWFMRHNGIVHVTGNCKVAFEEPWVDPIGIPHPGRIRIIPLSPLVCSPEYHPHDKDRIVRMKIRYKFYGRDYEGKRTVMTFVELIDAETISQYINDELVEQYANPLGVMPIVHIPNVTVTGSPYGHSDVADIISLNRELNEKYTEISDMINYAGAPLTVLTGAKMANLERGAKRTVAIPSKDAKLTNLPSELSGIAPALSYTDLIKRAMHEITGIPEAALGQIQPISNTSGVALDIEYRPMMSRRVMKLIHMDKGLEAINSLIIRTAAVHMPEMLAWQPGLSSEPEADQVWELDPFDPDIYRTSVEWPEPLPIDKLVKLNELQAKMAMGLESKEGALRETGEPFPREKLAEINEELMDDLINQGVLDLERAKVQSAIMSLTGLVSMGDGTYGPPEPPPQSVTSAGGSNVTSAGSAQSGSGILPGIKPDGETVNQLTQRAAGAQLAQLRVPQDNNS